MGGLSSAEKSLLVRRFDPLEEGMVGDDCNINHESTGRNLKRKVDRYSPMRIFLFFRLDLKSLNKIALDAVGAAKQRKT